MHTRTQLIILFILVSAGCAIGPTAIVTESCIPGDAICREHDPNTGLVTRTTYTAERVEGIPTDHFEICNGKIDDKSIPESPKTECRQVISSTDLYGEFNPYYNCGGWGCSFWP